MPNPLVLHFKGRQETGSTAAHLRVRSGSSGSSLSHMNVVGAGILHAVKREKNSYKTLITAEYHSVKVELAPNFEMGVSNKPPEFIKMKPTGKVPVVETPDGPVFESNAIACYVTRLKP
nr:elongation factor 1-gamma [Quercus suber]